MTDESSLSQEIKDNAKLFHHFNLARVAAGKKDLATAKSEAAEFEKGAMAKNNPAQARLARGLNGLIALEEQNYDKALAELQQANLQNPYDLYRMCLAYQGKGDAAKKKEFCTKAANFNPLPQLNQAFVRTKAAKIAAS
jgi:tetratricopeptide (TPR) repeat protein